MPQKLVYIAGYGRSGSTLLERILSSNEKLFGSGELARLPNFLNRNSWTCSCGDDLRDCNFWGEIIETLEGNRVSTQTWKRTRNNHESLRGLFNLWTSKMGDSGRPYSDITERVFEALFQHLPTEVDYLIDSSKTARKSFLRPIALSRFAGLDVKMIHLVRDGRGCMWSNLKGSNRKMERGEDPNLSFAALRTAISWPLANIGAHLFSFLEGGENYLRVKYEDFVNYPEETLERIGDFIEVDLSSQIQMLANEEPILKTHQLTGNRMRRKESIVLSEDDEWKDSLSGFHNLLFWLLDWPWAFSYGYDENKRS